MNSPALKRLLGILAAPEERGLVPQVSSLGRFGQRFIFGVKGSSWFFPGFAEA